MKSLPCEEYQGIAQPRLAWYFCSLASGARETSAKAVSRERRWVSVPDSPSMLAVQPGHAASQSGPNITCWTISCVLSPNRRASVTVPSGPWNVYSLPIRTMGSRRRCAFSASRRRVCSFSVASSRFLASSHCSRVTTSGNAIPTSLGWRAAFGSPAT